MRNWLAAAALALAAAMAPGAAHAQVEDRVVNVSAQDKAMNDAIAHGRATVGEFFAHYGSPAKDESDFVVKFDLLPESDRAEFIWAKVLERTPRGARVQLINEPADTRFQLGQELTLADGQIVDWGYFKGPVMQGGFTTRVLLDHVAPEEAAAIRKAYGW
ncbi:DUF2314 domain-containing protein [Sphingomonas sp.]|uniref:DUF2314 domain-containing protein n=1 Tax=Sphingomonas sp. TaxID=28214 RepID=UPI001B1FC319|nr:DUF2314 domain-containing protein [Sphingomonas sp.]MBO9714026.1 DUF2314 domain-containing protein [Sphingomonas sp.]